MRTLRLRRSARESWCLWLGDADGAVWLQQRPPRGIWAGLWAWPMFDDEAACRRAAEAVSSLAGAAVRSDEPELQVLPGFVHVLTHLDWTLHPRRMLLTGCGSAGLTAERLQSVLGAGRWWAQAELAGLGLPAPLKTRLPLPSGPISP